MWLAYADITSTEKKVLNKNLAFHSLLGLAQVNRLDRDISRIAQMKIVYLEQFVNCNLAFVKIGLV